MQIFAVSMPQDLLRRATSLAVCQDNSQHLREFVGMCEGHPCFLACQPRSSWSNIFYLAWADCSGITHDALTWPALGSACFPQSAFMLCLHVPAGCDTFEPITIAEHTASPPESCVGLWQNRRAAPPELASSSQQEARLVRHRSWHGSVSPGAPPSLSAVPGTLCPGELPLHDLH